MPLYEIKYTTECTMEALVEASSEEEAVKKMTRFDIDDEPTEVDGGGFDESDMISIEVVE